MNKWFSFSLFAIMLLFALTSQVLEAEAAREITVRVDGRLVNFPDQQPVIISGRTLVPARGVFEALGFVASWEGRTQTATLSRHDYTIVLPIGSPTFMTNGVSFPLDEPARLMSGRTMLPLRLPLESIGYTFEWDGTTSSIFIISPHREVEPAPMPQPPPVPTPPPTAGSNFSFHYVFRTNVTIISQPPAYRVVVDGDILTVTVYSPTHALRQLTVGELFVFEPTAQNLEGLAGRVINISEQLGIMTIVARAPNSLDEIFYEFEMTAEFNLLEYADEIVLDEALQNVAGLQMERNRTNRIGLVASNANIDGIVINGRLQLFTPTVHARINLRGVDYLVLRTAAEINLSATAQGSFDRTFTLFTVPVRKFGTGIQIPVGLRVTGDGRVAIEVMKRVDTEFGIRNNQPVSVVHPTFSLDFDFEASATLTANIQARATVKFTRIYGVQGDFGMGIQSNSAMQTRCTPRACFVLETFHVRRISSLTDWGILSGVSLLRFDVDLARNLDTTFWYVHNGILRRYCVHAAGGMSVTPLNIAAPFTVRCGTHMGPRGSVQMGGRAFSDAFIYRFGPHCFSRHNLRGAFQVLTGYVGRVDGSGNVNAILNIIGDGRILDTFDLRATQGPVNITVNVAGVHELEIRFLRNQASGTVEYAHAFGVGNATSFVTISPNNIEMRTGTSRHFSASVHGSTQQGVVWSVSGNNSTGTRIDGNGQLTIASNETSTHILVRAAFVHGTAISGTASVTIGDWSLSATPHAPDFGTHILGYTQRPTQTITIRNTGNQPITLDELPEVPNWTLVAAANWRTTINPNQTRTFTIRPNLGLPAETYNPSIPITGNNRSVSVIITPRFVVGAGLFAITATPEAPDFGTHLLGYTNRPTQTVTIRNTGNQPITLEPLPAVPDWTLVPASNWDTQINPNQTRTFTIRPNHGLPAGTYNPTITVTASGGVYVLVRPTFVVGAGQFSITATPDAPDFGSHNLGYANRPTQTVTIRNTGNQPITLEPLPTVPNWTLVPASNWGTQINANQTRTFTIRPNHGLAAGTYNPVITITGSNNVSAEVRPLFVVVGANLSIAASPVAPDFGSVQEGYSAVTPVTITITNTGNQPVTLAALPSVTGWDLTTTSNWTTPFDAGQTRTFTLAPVTGLPVGTHSPTITIQTTTGQQAVIQPLFVVGAAEPSVTGVDVTRLGAGDLLPGDSVQFRAYVIGTNNPPQDVTWAIIGATVSSINADGLLSISTSETSTTITIRATSSHTPSAFGEYVVTVLIMPDPNPDSYG